MKVGDTVKTDVGEGIIVAHEEIYGKNRWGVGFDPESDAYKRAMTLYGYQPLYYFQKELEAINANFKEQKAISEITSAQD